MPTRLEGTAATGGRRETNPPPPPQTGKVKQVRTDRRMIEIKAPELFQFNGVGDFVDGVLIRIDVISIKDKATSQPKRVSQYTFRKENGDAVKILGTYDIDSKIAPGHIGRFVEVTYVGENREVKRGDNYMKVFRVSVEEKSAAPASSKFNDGTEITDEDIPF